MSSIQQGIQAAHSTAELFVKYRDKGILGIDDYEQTIEEHEYQDKVQDLYDWAENHKTMVCLNGGNLQGLKDIETLFQEIENKFAWSSFYEDEESLGSILTNIAIIVPEYIYDTTAKIRSGEYMLCYDTVIEKPIKEFLTIVGSPALQTPRTVMKLSEFEIKLLELLNSCQLAR
jgi:hypothetical protein